MSLRVHATSVAGLRAPRGGVRVDEESVKSSGACGSLSGYVRGVFPPDKLKAELRSNWVKVGVPDNQSFSLECSL